MIYDNLKQFKYVKKKKQFYIYFFILFFKPTKYVIKDHQTLRIKYFDGLKTLEIITFKRKLNFIS